MPLSCLSVPLCDDDGMSAPVTGTVRIGEVRSLAGRLGVGEIAVINLVDPDREAAELLLARSPAAVLNAADSATGRLPNLGPSLLLDAGIPLVDSFDSDVLSLREGQEIRLEDGIVSVDGREIAEGRVVTREDLADAARRAGEGTRFQLDGVSAATADLLAREPALVLDGAGLPDLRELVGDRPTLVIAPRSTTAEMLEAIRLWIREEQPVVIAVDAAADTARDARITPDVIIGDLDSVSHEALGAGARLILHVPREAGGGGAVRTEELGVDHDAVNSLLPTPVLALLLAAHGQANVVVAAGFDETPQEVLDGGRESAAATSLARYVLGSRLVHARALPGLVKPRIRAWQLVILAVVAVFALLLALLTTPVGQAAVGVGPDWLQDLLSAPKEEPWSTSGITSSL